MVGIGRFARGARLRAALFATTLLVAAPPVLAQTTDDGEIDFSRFDEEGFSYTYVYSYDTDEERYRSVVDPTNTVALEQLSPSALLSNFNINPITTDFEAFSIANVQGGILFGGGFNEPVSANGTSAGAFGAITCGGGQSSLDPATIGDFDGDFIDALDAADAYGVGFRSASYQQAYNGYRNWLSGGTTQPIYFSETITPTQFTSAVYGCGLTSTAYASPLVGNPESVQFQQIADGLDLSMPALGEDDAAWGIGLRVGRTQNGTDDYGTQVAARVNYSFRPFEGSRTLVTIDVPFTYSSNYGVEQYRGYAAIGATIPLSPTWTLQPRISYGYANVPDAELSGQVGSATLASTWFFPNLIGRGALTLGALIGYSKVTHVTYLGNAIDANTENVSFRGGAAYELPLGNRVGGRAASVRASYAFTTMTGDDLFVKDVHELTASFGVRSRESTQRSSFELFRLGVMARLARLSNGFHLFAGYRF